MRRGTLALLAAQTALAASQPQPVPFEGLRHALHALLPWVLFALALAVVLPGLSCLPLLASRSLARRNRNLRRLWVLPYRSDEANHDAVRRLLEAWHQQLLQRWWRRPLDGQPGMTLELRLEPDGQG